MTDPTRITAKMLDIRDQMRAIHGDDYEARIAPFLERERSEAVAWKQTAEQELRNVEYYRGLLVRIGESFREAARVQDDGGIADSVLVAKVPELVEQLWRDHASWKRVAEYRENGLDQHWKALTAYRAALSNEEDIEDGPEPGDPPRPNWAMKAAALFEQIMAKHGVKV